MRTQSVSQTVRRRVRAGDSKCSVPAGVTELRVPNVMARLKPGVTLEQARRDVLEIAARIREKDRRDATSRSIPCRWSSPSSETFGWPCWCCSDSWRSCCLSPA